MNTSLILALDTRKKKTDGTYSVILRLTHFGISSQITLGLYLTEADWDTEKRRVKSSFKGTESVTRLNNWLQKKKSAATDIITKLDEQGILNGLSAQEVKQRIQRKPESTTFAGFTEILIAELIETNKIGNARTYEFTLSVLKKFIGKKDFAFRDITPSLLTSMEHEHIKKGKAYSGLSVYLRTVRAIFNKAIAADIIEAELYPFKKYTIKGSKSRKRAIKIDAIKRIENLDLALDHPLYHTRHYFLISFYLRGISFADLAHLQVQNIIDGRIYYERQKVDTNYNIKITKEVKAILDLYLEGKQKEDFIFPFIKRQTAVDQYKDIEWARHRFNRSLKKLATLCNIQENLTSYVSRHSFATRAKNLGIPISHISDMLGHENIKTTEIYLDSLSSDELDNFHEQVIK